MAAETLFRVDPERNMARFYKVDIQPTLFGEWAVIREWGRIGRCGTVRHTAYETVSAAQSARDRQCGKKLKRGYVSCIS
jgi:predicted DNA-binding WGR domain protein